MKVPVSARRGRGGERSITRIDFKPIYLFETSIRTWLVTTPKVLAKRFPSFNRTISLLFMWVRMCDALAEWRWCGFDWYVCCAMSQCNGFEKHVLLYLLSTLLYSNTPVETFIIFSSLFQLDSLASLFVDYINANLSNIHLLLLPRYMMFQVLAILGAFLLNAICRSSQFGGFVVVQYLCPHEVVSLILLQVKYWMELWYITMRSSDAVEVFGEQRAIDVSQ